MAWGGEEEPGQRVRARLHCLERPAELKGGDSQGPESVFPVLRVTVRIYRVQYHTCETLPSDAGCIYHSLA